MRKIRDVLRLSAGGMSKRKIAASLGMSPTAAGDCMRRARRAGVSWPLPEAMSDEALGARLYPPPPSLAKEQRPRPDWPTIHRELKRPGVTLQLLWGSTARRTLTAMAIAGSAISTGPGKGGCQPFKAPLQ